jgi:hypothetical protein
MVGARQPGGAPSEVVTTRSHSWTPFFVTSTFRDMHAEREVSIWKFGFRIANLGVANADGYTAHKRPAIADLDSALMPGER